MEAADLAELTTKQERELAVLRELERTTHEFNDFVDNENAKNFRNGREYSPFAPPTLRHVEIVRLLHQRLDQIRSEGCEGDETT